jgi:hypothetical protein
MDYGGHDKIFHDNLVVVACYDGQACVSGGGSYPPGAENASFAPFLHYKTENASFALY